MGVEVFAYPERENDEFIKSSVDDLVPIPRESELTLDSTDIECRMPINPPLPCVDVLGDIIVDIDLLLGEHLDTFSTGDREIDFNPIRDIEELERLLGDDPVPVLRVFDAPLGHSDLISRSFDVTFSNLLFDFNDDYTLCYDNLLFDEELEDIIGWKDEGDGDPFFGFSSYAITPSCCILTYREIPSGESKVHIEVLSVLWGNRLSIPDGSLPLSRRLLLRYLEELDKLIDERVLKYGALRMKEKEVQAIKKIERQLQKSEMQKQESLVSKGTTLEDCMVTNAAYGIESENSSSVTPFSRSEDENRSSDKDCRSSRNECNRSGNENRSSNHESTSSRNDADADIGPSYDSDTVTENNSNIISNIPNMDPDRDKEEHDDVDYEQQRAFLASLINNLKCDVEKMTKLSLGWHMGQTDQTLRMLLPKEDNVQTGKQGIGFEYQNDNVNPSVLNKAKELASCFYNIDEIRKDLLSDHKINSEEELKCEAEKFKNVNLQLNCFEKSLVKEMKDDLKYVISLEDEFDETCLLLDIRQEFFKTQFDMEKGLLGPNGGSGGLIESRLGERCGRNGGRGSSMSGVGEGNVDSMGGMGGGLLAICLMVLNDGRGGGGLVVESGSSSRESRKACGKVVGAGGSEVNGGGVDLGVSKRLLLEVAEEMIGESGRIEVGEVRGGAET
ncbi:hypothetical protein Tco_0387076 [Tanacetum coccineum]